MTPKTAKLFMNGRSQAVRLPKAFRFEGDEVLIHRDGDRVILTPKPRSWRDFFKNGTRPTDDFMSERIDEPPQERETAF
jgi:antitoxin VapB